MAMPSNRLGRYISFYYMLTSTKTSSNCSTKLGFIKYSFLFPCFLTSIIWIDFKFCKWLITAGRVTPILSANYDKVRMEADNYQLPK